MILLDFDAIANELSDRIDARLVEPLMAGARTGCLSSAEWWELGFLCFSGLGQRLIVTVC
jgi:hypothetical protein